ncbi:MAG: RES family NAD+ phosphorylase [Acidobacteria bacterium]|nr:RES family NAD+ phosphorylase [Acidobacteriota bacterium]
MFAWRLASGNYPPLTGEGARLVGGRWNSPGRPLIYASESLALCLAECLVHVTGSLPLNYVAFKISFPDGEAEELNVKTLKAGWERDLARTRATGDKWWAGARSLALIVPSVVLPESRNILLNPQHPSAARMRLVSQQPFTFDPRLRPTR